MFSRSDTSTPRIRDSPLGNTLRVHKRDERWHKSNCAAHRKRWQLDKLSLQEGQSRPSEAFVAPTTTGGAPRDNFAPISRGDNRPRVERTRGNVLKTPRGPRRWKARFDRAARRGVSGLAGQSSRWKRTPNRKTMDFEPPKGDLHTHVTSPIIAITANHRGSLVPACYGIERV